MRKIILLGYMGCGKSTIAVKLAKTLKIPFVDLDEKIEEKENLSINTIFETRGEIYFRKQERELLEEIFATKDQLILSVGGGTPAYYNNIEVINQNSESIFLRTSVKTLTERLLKQKQKRPLIANIADEDLPEFIAKHLFERNFYYSKAKYTVDTDDKEVGDIVEEIERLF